MNIRMRRNYEMMDSHYDEQDGSGTHSTTTLIPVTANNAVTFWIKLECIVSFNPPSIPLTPPWPGPTRAGKAHTRTRHETMLCTNAWVTTSGLVAGG